jgi:mono/diheme cytochrome c family protein
VSHSAPRRRGGGARRLASRAGRVARVLAAGAAVLAAPGCKWFTAFVEQPKIDPWEVVTFPGKTLVPSRGNPQLSVPITGTSVSGLQVSYMPLPGVVDSMSAIANPTPPSDASLVNGRKVFQINCSPCHGDAGTGNGPVTKWGIPAPSLVADHAKSLSDGYLYGMIRNGRGAMPTYNRIEDLQRWDVVNYVRGLQGKLPQPVPVGPVGYPGQTGDALPGYTMTAPTRPVPYYRGPGTLDSLHAIHAGTPGPAPATPPAAGAAR